MFAYLIRRVIFATLLVFLVSSASLVLARLAPGDFTVELLGDRARPDAIERTRAHYGLNRPVIEQYRDWIAHADTNNYRNDYRMRRMLAMLRDVSGKELLGLGCGEGAYH